MINFFFFSASWFGCAFVNTSSSSKSKQFCKKRLPIFLLVIMKLFWNCGQILRRFVLKSKSDLSNMEKYKKKTTIKSLFARFGFNFRYKNYSQLRWNLCIWANVREARADICTFRSCINYSKFGIQKKKKSLKTIYESVEYNLSSDFLRLFLNIFLQNIL